LEMGAPPLEHTYLTRGHGHTSYPI
jgi:hypothetical protein